MISLWRYILLFTYMSCHKTFKSALPEIGQKVPKYHHATCSYMPHLLFLRELIIS